MLDRRRPPDQIAPDFVPRFLRLQVRGVDVWEPNEVDGVRFTAVPAIDWRGDDQVSWIIESNGWRIIHCGDTIWHGRWWRIAGDYGPFDWAFLPISGAITVYPGLEPSGLPATLTPKQPAWRLAHAAKFCPIHYGTFNNPPVYMEQADMFEALA